MNQDDIVNHILLELRLLIKNFHHSRIKKDFGFTYNESLLMKALRERPGMHPRELAEIVGSEKSTISRQVTTLEKKGYLQKIEDPLNKRSHRLALTAFGEQALQDSDQLWAGILEKHLEDWAPDERQLFLTLLEKYNRTANLN